MIVRPPQSHEEFAQYFDLRWRVLRAPWGQPRGSEQDELENSAEHAMIVDDAGRVLAVGRLHFNSHDEAQIRYMAVDDEARGRGLGSLIVEYFEQIARQRGANVIVLNARNEVTGFYARLGYEIVGEGPTMFDIVAHSKMSKRLA
jgi:N-acetylglutamate synthase-like GNAT family acetyltransferase